jgi:hypothetical protein
MMLCSITLLLSEGMSQKLIVYTDKNVKNAQESLLKLKVYFIESPKIRALNEDNDIQLELETLGAYTMVVVKPILSLSVKNSLLMELSPVFPDVFALENRTLHQADTNEAFIPVKNDESIASSVQKFMRTIGLQWITLLMLATVGLLLSILRRKKLLILDEKQKELDIDQKEIENEINNLGKNNA